MAAQRKRQWASKVESPFLRGPARLLDAMAIIPQIRRALPEAKLPFQRPAVVGGDGRQRHGREGSCAALARSARRPRSSSAACSRSHRPHSPSATADVAAYHGAEHISIGSYEQGKRATKEHNRCGSHLIGPLLVTTAIGNTLAARAPAHVRRPVRLGAQLVALAASTEIFGWMVRNPENRLARALAKPGHELQHRLATAEPTPEQIEVAEAALAACLELEKE